MDWGIAGARERFSELIRATAVEPQLVLSRDRLVAVVISPAEFEQFENWRTERARRSIADVFAELRAICEAEDFVLEVPPRTNRTNAFAETLDDLPV